MTRRKTDASTVIGIEEIGGDDIKSEESIRVLIVSRYMSVRIGLRAMLEGRAAVAVVGESTGVADIESYQTADVVLFDFEEESSEALFVEAAGRQSAVVLLGADSDVIPCLMQFKIQGWAILPRDAGGDEIAAAVHAASEGLLVLTPGSPPYPHAAAPAVPGEAVLTDRELEILQLMAEGLPNKQIATRLGISLHTAKFHVAAILSKMAVGSRTEAVTNALRQGLLHL